MSSIWLVVILAIALATDINCQSRQQLNLDGLDATSYFQYPSRQVAQVADQAGQVIGRSVSAPIEATANSIAAPAAGQTTGGAYSRLGSFGARARDVAGRAYHHPTIQRGVLAARPHLDLAMQKGRQAYAYAVPKFQQTVEMTKPYLNTAVERSRQAYGYAAPKLQQTAQTTGQLAMNTGKQAYGYAVPKIQQTAQVTRPHLERGGRALSGLLSTVGSKLPTGARSDATGAATAAAAPAASATANDASDNHVSS